MRYVLNRLQRLGKLGIFVSYIASLGLIVLLYLGYIAGNLTEPAQRSTLSFILVVAVTYRFVRQINSWNKIDKSLFETYPITTLTYIEDNILRKGVDSFYIGRAKDMGRYSDWTTISKQYKLAKGGMAFYDPQINPNEQSVKLFGNERILGVKYKDGLFQFVQVEPVSNDLFTMIKFLKSFAKRGVRVDGKFESLKDTQPQFTSKRWAKIILIIFVVTVSFIFVSVYVSGKYLDV